MRACSSATELVRRSTLKCLYMHQKSLLLLIEMLNHHAAEPWRILAEFVQSFSERCQQLCCVFVCRRRPQTRAGAVPLLQAIILVYVFSSCLTGAYASSSIDSYHQRSTFADVRLRPLLRGQAISDALADAILSLTDLSGLDSVSAWTPHVSQSHLQPRHFQAICCLLTAVLAHLCSAEFSREFVTRLRELYECVCDLLSVPRAVPMQSRRLLFFFPLPLQRWS